MIIICHQMINNSIRELRVMGNVIWKIINLFVEGIVIKWMSNSAVKCVLIFVKMCRLRLKFGCKLQILWEIKVVNSLILLSSINCYWNMSFSIWYLWTKYSQMGTHCILKVEKATKASFTGFFSCYLSPNVPHGQDCIKTQAYDIKI